MGQNQRRPSGFYTAAHKAISGGAEKCKRKGHRGGKNAKAHHCTRCGHWTGRIIA